MSLFRFARLMGSLSLCVLPGLLWVAPSAHAQEEFVFSTEVEGSPAPSPNNAKTGTPGFKAPSTLKEAVAMAYWNPSARGPLLVISGENTRPWTPKRDPEDPRKPIPPAPPLGPPPPDGYRPEVIAPYFGRKPIRLPSLTVLAPTEMTLLNTDIKGKPDPFASMRSGEKIPLLLQTLSADQWRTLTSPGGLGMDSLDAAQRELFLSLLPKKIKITEFKMQQETEVYQNTQNKPPRELSDAERARIRLRVNRTAQLHIPTSLNAQGYGTQVSNYVPGRTYYSVENNEYYSKPTLYGVKIKDEFPNKLKPGHLNFDAPAFNRTMSLENIKTVGELIKKIKEDSGVELYADGRLTRLSLQAMGGETGAKTGDILKALCWAVCGTWRKVGPAFVLTHDVEGIGAKRARISEWQNWGRQLESDITQRAQQKIKEQKPGQYMSFAPDDPLALNDDLMARVQESRKDPENAWRGGMMKMQDLPDSLRQRAIETVANYNKNEKQAARRPLIPDRVRVSTTGNLTYLLPGGGEAQADGGYALYSLEQPDYRTFDAKYAKDPSTLPKAFSERCVLLWDGKPGRGDTAPTIGAAWDTIAQISKAQGLKELWVQLPLDPLQDAEVLAPALVAGKKHGLPVYAQVRLMAAPPTKPGDTPPAFPVRDQTITGEASGTVALRGLNIPEVWPGVHERILRQGDYLRPDDPKVVPYLTKRLAAIGKTPGVAGIVLIDSVPPGYRDPGMSEWYDGDSSTVGFTPELRLAFLREHGYDPIDLGGDYWGVDTNVPLFGDIRPRYIELSNGDYGADPKSPNPRSEWGKLRHKQAVGMLSTLYAKVRAELPKTPLVMREVGENYYSYYATWESAEKIPLLNDRNLYREDGPSPLNAALKSARATSQTAFFTTDLSHVMSPPPAWYKDESLAPGSVQAFRRTINSQFDRMKKRSELGGWDGFVLDVRTVPQSNLSAFLKDLQMNGSNLPDKTDKAAQ